MWNVKPLTLNTKHYHYTSEFVDVFKTKDILQNGIGFFDDGIDSRNFNLLAIGDSFTRGVGSENNILNGWVELSENTLKNTDIINLGNLGRGINQHRYGYSNIKKIFKYDGVIHNLFSGGDYKDNLKDIHYSYYIKNNSKKLGKRKIQNIINDLQVYHGYKYNLEYLSKNNLKSYSIYFFLKIYDLLINKGIFTGHNHINLPLSQIRLKVVSDELFNIKNSFSTVCLQKYCYRENFVFEDINLRNKIIKNSADKINSFYSEVTKNDGKEFFLVIHPSSRNFLTNKTKIDYNFLDKELISLLNKNIKILYLMEPLNNLIQDKPEIEIFHKFDGHYNIKGYKIVSEYISNFLIKNLY